jgi:hypothetical protein
MTAAETQWRNQGGRIANILQVVEDAEPQAWRLVGLGEQYSPTEELVFKIQGVIEKKMLPPVPDNKR